MTKTMIVIVNHNTCQCLYQCLASIMQWWGGANAASSREGAAAFSLNERCVNETCAEESDVEESDVEEDAAYARAAIERSMSVEIVVVDNASTDGSVEMVRTCFPDVLLQENHANLGYGAAANQAIARCDADYVLLLNSDTLLDIGVVEALQRYLDEHPEAAVVGPRLHNPDGTLQASCYPAPTPFHLFLEESLLGRLAAHIPGLCNRYLRTWRHDEVRAVPWVLGAVLAIRRNAFLAVGGFEPAYYMYFEETDLCHRLWTAGWQVHFAPVGTVVHIGGASTSRYDAKMQYQLFDSTQLFYTRHYTRAQARLLRLVMIPVLLARLVRDTARYIRVSNTQTREGVSEVLRVRCRILRQCLFPSLRSG